MLEISLLVMSFLVLFTSKNVKNQNDRWIFPDAVYRLNEKNVEYMALEDEFRMALEIEADRYNKVEILMLSFFRFFY